MLKKSISVVFPVYNEEKNVYKTMNTFLSFLPPITDDFEIVVVDDASTDKSLLLLDGLAKDNTRIKILHNHKNRKLGGTLKEGFRGASKELILYSDFDMPFDVKEIANALEIIRLTNADIISAYRTNRNADGLLRLVYSSVYNFIIGFLFRLDITDVNFSFKLFKREVLNHIKLDSEGSFINVEFLIKAQRNNFRIVQFPVKYFPRQRGCSTLSSPRVILKIIYELLELCPKLRNPCKRDSLYLTKKLYKKVNFSTRLHNIIRRATCPFKIIEKYIPMNRDILDIGCGTGFFTNLLAINGNGRNVIGIDKNESKVKAALKTINKRQNIKFEIGDIKDISFPQNNHCLTMLDVLYLLPAQTQVNLLKKCFDALSQDGLLILKGVDIFPRWKYWFTLLQELVAIRMFPDRKGDKLYFRSSKDLSSILKNIGFRVISIIDIGRGYWYPHMLYICSKS